MYDLPVYDYGDDDVTSYTAQGGCSIFDYDARQLQALDDCLSDYSAELEREAYIRNDMQAWQDERDGKNEPRENRKRLAFEEPNYRWMVWKPKYQGGFYAKGAQWERAARRAARKTKRHGTRPPKSKDVPRAPRALAFV